MSEAQNGVNVMERLTFDGNFCDIAQCTSTPGGSFCEDGSCSARKVWERLKAYEATELTPEEIDMDHEAAEQLRHLCRDCDLEQLEELAEADKEGRLFLLPLEPGRPMLCQEHFERTWVMKNVAPCVQYQSSVGVVFHMEYDVFRGLVERGKITPLSPEGEKALEAMKDG